MTHIQTNHVWYACCTTLGVYVDTNDTHTNKSCVICVLYDSRRVRRHKWHTYKQIMCDMRVCCTTLGVYVDTNDTHTNKSRHIRMRHSNSVRYVARICVMVCHVTREWVVSHEWCEWVMSDKNESWHKVTVWDMLPGFICMCDMCVYVHA